MKFSSFVTEVRQGSQSILKPFSWDFKRKGNYSVIFHCMKDLKLLYLLRDQILNMYSIYVRKLNVIISLILIYKTPYCLSKIVTFLIKIALQLHEIYALVLQ